MRRVKVGFVRLSGERERGTSHVSTLAQLLRTDWEGFEFWEGALGSAQGKSWDAVHGGGLKEDNVGVLFNSHQNLSKKAMSNVEI